MRAARSARRELESDRRLEHLLNSRSPAPFLLTIAACVAQESVRLGIQNFVLGGLALALGLIVAIREPRIEQLAFG